MLWAVEPLYKWKAQWGYLMAAVLLILGPICMLNNYEHCIRTRTRVYHLDNILGYREI